MRTSQFAGIVLSGALLFAPPAFAHHGKDFLVVESYELPHPHTLFFVESDYLSTNSDGTALEDEPSLLVGVAPRFAVEMHAHFAKEPGQGYGYEAFAPAAHVQLTNPASPSAWKIAASAEYEIARQEDDRAELRAIAQRSVGDGALVLNLIGSKTRGEDAEAGYAVAFRPALERRTSWGVEAIGTLKRERTHEALFGIYHEASERVTWKLGAGADVGAGKPAFVVRTGLVVKLR